MLAIAAACCDYFGLSMKRDPERATPQNALFLYENFLFLQQPRPFCALISNAYWTATASVATMSNLVAARMSSVDNGAVGLGLLLMHSLCFLA